MAVLDPQAAEGITVVIPAYNYERYLAEAVHSALHQDWTGPVEVLIIDDGSTDGTQQVAEGFGDRVTYHRKLNGGLSAARNTGMELARFARVVFLDADDVLEPHALRRLAETWDSQHPRPVVIGSQAQMIDGEGRPFGEPDESVQGSRLDTFAVADFVLRNRFSPIVLADKATLLALGGFDPALKASEDRDMWIRSASRGPVLRINERLHRKRDHGTNMSRQAERQTQCILQVLAKNAAAVTTAQLRRAQAVCFYQSARMHLAAGHPRRALTMCLRSIWTQPWITQPAQANLPHSFRLKFLLLLLMKSFRA